MRHMDVAILGGFKVMLNASEEQILALFERVHGKLDGSCSAEVIYDDDWNVIGVACLKHGHEAWRATLVELLVDLKVEERDA